ncbi:hypothetical protein ACEN9X_04300 [Mucilaginibacter sp. Mucisp86]|uniref:hypothetical protein n=1 Tax=Mucilaginibacter sp. Mucisp86 TaxID=3243060 RepID=UPI0039B5D926
MHFYKKYVGPILITICVSCFCKNSLAQSPNETFNRDSSKTITLIEFKHRVGRATKLLKTEKLSAISDTDHINIMMCLNTIFMTHLYKNGLFEARFEAAEYKNLEILADKKNYSRDIVKVYSEWVPNRGMGYYFPKLKMELYGTPMRYAIFNVLE